MLRILSLTLSLLFSARSVFSADWPQYRGPLRNDISTETGLLKAWTADGPQLLWNYSNSGIGYSGMAIVGDQLFTIGARNESEYLIALDLKKVTGGTVKEAWATKVGPLFDWEGNQWSAGPSSTPTVDGDHVYALGGMGDLICARVSDGKEIWRVSLPRDLEAQVNPIGGGPKNLGWGFTWSPLVDGEKLICTPGGPKGTVAALDKKTGKVLWRSTEVTDQASYASVLAADIEGVRQYVVLTNQGLTGVEASSGRVLWSHRRKPAYGTEVVNSPIIQGAFVYATVGAGQGCELLQIHREGEMFRAEPVYANKNMGNHHGNVALFGDHVFGFSEGKGWICQALASGEIVWAEKSKLRAGSMTVADGHIYCYSEDNGTVALIEANTTGWTESGRFVIPKSATTRKPKGRIWTPPVISGGRLFLRDQELIFCFDVKAKD